MLKSLPEEMWLARFQAQELREHARVLYVAVTRAIETVFMSWNAKVEKNSWAEMTRLNATPGVHREEGYSFAVLNEVCELKRDRNEARTVLTVREKWSASKEMRDFDGKAFSVTDLVEGRVARDYAVATTPDMIRRLKVASQGTAVHRLMELLKYRSPELLHQLIQKWFPEQEERVLAAVEFVRDLSAPPLMEIIKNGAVEWGFAFTEKGMLVEGQVDLWGRADDGRLWIADYKTGSPEFVEKAMTQMTLYALALHKAGLVRDGEEIHLAAVYPFAQKVLVEKATSSVGIQAIANSTSRLPRL
jgi:ATP-dependent helicase/nuclease subunit A